jgi:hypothetical protein
LSYSTYLGGSLYDYATAIAVDSAGNAYITGWTYSGNFPTTVGAFQTTFGGSRDGFVTKLNASGTAVVYSTYLGGSSSGSSSGGSGIAVDASGDAYVTGGTSSTNFPTTAGAFQTTPGGGFVTELNPSGTALVYSTYFASGAAGIVVDSGGNAYLTGSAGANFPTTAGAFQTTLAGSADAFVTKLNASGTALVYSTYLGGSGGEGFGGVGGAGIAVDSAGNAYVTGGMGSNFPTTAGAFQTTYSGGHNDAFVTKLNASGTALVYSTYLGGNASKGVVAQQGYGIAVDSTGNAYVTGQTSTTNFPTTTGAFQTTYGGAIEPFVTKLNASGTALVYSTYLGASHNTGAFSQGYGIAVDNYDNAYVTGFTLSTDFPTTAGALQTTLGGSGGNAFVTEMNVSGTALVYSTYLGGTGGDQANGIALDSAGNFYITGYATPSFPTTAGAYQTTYGGGDGDGFVAEFAAGVAINPTGLPAATVAAGYSQTLSASGGTAPYTFAVTAGSLPAGLTLSVGGVLSGTPIAAGPSSFTVTATDANSTTGSLSYTLAAYPASLSVSGFPSPTTAGVAGTLTVTALDANGNVIPSYQGTVHFSSSDSHAVLPANYTFTAANQGVFTFTVTLETVGSQSITATDTAVASVTGSETGISVVAPIAAMLVFSNVPSSTTAGSAFNVTVTAEDAYGNIATGYSGTVHFTSSDPQSVLPANYTFTAGDNGQHTFSATLETAGTQSLTATDTVTSSIFGTASGIVVNPAAAARLSITALPASVTSGKAYTFTVTALDAYGNTASGYRGTVKFTSSDKKATVPANYTFTAANNGVHAFTNGVTFKTTGSQTLTATDTKSSTITGAVTVTVGSAQAVPATLLTSPAQSLPSPLPSAAEPILAPLPLAPSKPADSETQSVGLVSASPAHKQPSATAVLDEWFATGGMTTLDSALFINPLAP